MVMSMGKSKKLGEKLLHGHLVAMNIKSPGVKPETRQWDACI
jgi:hypothetical protein